jgi:methylmalonyl-CoA mutase C-terminal domain/subunit
VIAAPSTGRIRVLLGKPGLDGHDRGVKVIARLLRDHGCEVVYSGLRQRPDAIARAAVEEDVDVIGVSILSGSHMRHVTALLAALDALDASSIPVIVGGTVPPVDADALRAMGVAAVFGVESPLEEIAAAFLCHAHR